MSPEQATGDRVIDRRSDIYSLAAVTYEMLTGEPPHTGNTMQAIIARVLTDRPRSVRSMRPNLPEHVEIALDRALEKIPADRWTSAREFAEVLQGRAAAGGARGAVSRFAPAPARTWRMRLKDPLVLGLAALAAAGAVFGAWQWGVARRAEPRGIVRFTLALSGNVRTFAASSQVTKLAISPDGHTLAFIGVTDNGGARIFTRTTDDLRLRLVAGSEGALTLFFSPDGKWIGFLATGSIKKIPVSGGTPIEIAPAPGTLQGASWGRNGKIVFSTNNHLYVVPDRGGAEPLAVLTPDSSRRDLLEYEPLLVGDGNTLIFTSSSTTGAANGRLGVASLATGKSHVLDIPAIAPLALIDGVLIYSTTQGVMFAVPFDASSGRATGVPVAVQTDVAGNLLTGAVQAAISENGTLVFESGSEISDLMLVDQHGGGKAISTDARAFGYPRFSPDGKKIAVGINTSNRSDVWVLDLASATFTRLTTEGIINERPEWTPDGKRVLFRTDVDGRSGLWWRPADLSEPATALLSRPRWLVYEGVVTPDGKHLVYQLDTIGADLYYRALAGDTMPRPIATSPAFIEDMPRLSPDGRWIAFVTDEPGVQQVVVQPFPGPGARTQISADGGVEPVWSRDGSRIFYRDNQDFRAVTVRVGAGGAFEVVKREILFADHFVGSTLPHANYDVAPDGQHFLFMRPSQTAEIEVVYNWREELRARLAGRAATP
jgi:serine/threonine-protein kinase